MGGMSAFPCSITLPSTTMTAGAQVTVETTPLLPDGQAKNKKLGPLDISKRRRYGILVGVSLATFLSVSLSACFLCALGSLIPTLSLLTVRCHSHDNNLLWTHANLG